MERLAETKLLLLSLMCFKVTELRSLLPTSNEALLIKKDADSKKLSSIESYSFSSYYTK